jgi:phage shock protein PspC (stress-responsive transcriptional regulator)
MPTLINATDYGADVSTYVGIIFIIITVLVALGIVLYILKLGMRH